jgi:hypothetical protein
MVLSGHKSEHRQSRHGTHHSTELVPSLDSVTLETLLFARIISQADTSSAGGVRCLVHVVFLLVPASRSWKKVTELNSLMRAASFLLQKVERTCSHLC